MKITTLKKNYEFNRVFKKGQFAASKYLTIYINRNNTTYNRYGITVSKKYGKSVVRNRIKRLIRENIRKIENCLKQGYDIVIVARKSEKKAEYKKIKKNKKK